MSCLYLQEMLPAEAAEAPQTTQGSVDVSFVAQDIPQPLNLEIEILTNWSLNIHMKKAVGLNDQQVSV